jgi:hypothetical protein
MDLDTQSMAIVTEELSRGWLSVGSVMTRMLITGSLIMSAGTEAQKKKFLPKIAAGEMLTAAAFTEPDVGSDTASMKLRAVKKGDVRYSRARTRRSRRRTRACRSCSSRKSPATASHRRSCKAVRSPRSATRG